MRRAGLAALLVLAGCGGLEYGELAEPGIRPGGGDDRTVEASSPRIAANRPPDGRITVRPGDDLYSIARRYGVSADELIELNALVAPYHLPPGRVLELPEPRTYEVVAGDTLSGIAERLGVPLALLVRRNGLTPPYPIYVGQTLQLPDRSEEGPRQAFRVAESPDPVQASVPARVGAGRTATPPVPAPVEMVVESGVRELPPTPDGDGPPSDDRPEGGPETGEGARESEAPPESESRVAVHSAPGDGMAASAADAPIREAEASSADGPIEEAEASPTDRPIKEAEASSADGPIREAETSPKDAPIREAEASPTDNPNREAEVRAVERLDSGTGPAAPDPTVPTEFQRPVTGRIIAGYGPQPNGLRNDGLNFVAPPGSPVRATAAGTVAYVGNEVPGFGNLVLIRHDGGWVSAYAHNERVLVTKGDPVEQGDRIALVGSTGRVTRPQLHFELRRNGEPVDPLPLIGGR